MIRPSPELLAVARRWYSAVVARRPGELQHFLSKDASVGFVGSAEGEMWFGPAVRQGIGAHFGEIPDVLSIEERFAQAFENGGTGWSFFAIEIQFESRPNPIVFHSTLIFVLEEGSWKIAFRQTSVPSPNLATTGHEHSAIQALVEAAQKGFSLSQRAGFASVMFTDIVNSSRFASVMGDRLWSSEVARHFANLRNIIEDAGGQFVKSLGDGTMSSFASPEQALHAAVTILRDTADSDGPVIALRIGIHTGDVVQTDEDFFGTVVNKAARIAALALPDEIRVSDATRGMAGPASGFTFADPASVKLKGMDGEHLVHRLEWRT